MEQQQPIDPAYVKGFNEGYLTVQYFPALAERLAAIKSQTMRLLGFQDGRLEYLQEKTREHRPRWLSPDKGKDLGHDPTKDRDLEPDR